MLFIIAGRRVTSCPSKIGNESPGDAFVPKFSYSISMDEAPSWLQVILVTQLLLLTLFAGESTAQLIRNFTTFKIGSSNQVAEGMVLLVNNATKNIGCGFSSVQCPNRPQKCLVLGVAFLGKDGGFLPDHLVWTANGNDPVSPQSTIVLTAQGNLELRDARRGLVWSTNTSNLGVRMLKLKMSGNLVLVTANGTEVWRSFDHPTDTLMPEQMLHIGKKLEAYKSSSGLDLRTGDYSLVVEERKVVMYVNNTMEQTLSSYAAWSLKSDVNATIGWLKFSKTRDLLAVFSANFTMLDRTKVRTKNRTLRFMRLERDGSLNLHFETGKPFPLNKKLQGSKFQVPLAGECSLPFKCRRYGICSGNGNCSCPSEDFRGSKRTCELRRPLLCNKNASSQRLIRLENTDYFSTQFDAGIPVSSVDECMKLIVENCSWDVAIFKDVRNRSLCYGFRNVLSLINVTGSSSATSLAFIKVENPPQSSSSSGRQRRRRTAMWLAVSLAIATLVLVPLALLYLRSLSRQKNVSDELLESIPGVPRRFTFLELKNASANFSRKLGRGGFGTVYHGMLEDGTKVAIKRLESSRGGGDDQFRAEVIAIGSVHHSNLVKLIGFCCDEHKHTLLVYEYMPNGSLDMWIFARDDNNFLDWRTRSKIALDIAKGLSYLHEGCDQSILHLDIKPQNILLDVEFKAKISDFGLAIFAAKGSNNLRDTALRGTPGYMAPEWLRCEVSLKIDVYSFGIVLLEIVSGKQALEFLDAIDHHSDSDDDHRPFHAEQSDLVELLDPRLKGWSYSSSEVERFVLVALCCIQDDPSARPGMGNVVKMLEGNLAVPDPLISQRYQSTAIPFGIASFLASRLRSSKNTH
ncbi:G-type lectin S-receptor-like serine/threonine-protein kinase SD2-5 [Selaginella moellendorffii]|uniref:G-type lectin S-receptor-like serine/threonine-protein kinase SD2-5 n=1 Tax=Selaginella moellendorffii TaxID=88036 RepID=UPI000D1C8DC8|nr:G-type lectin S-receptor-like serine/threonine-protein kinase SD2-5 [Selaginella moellendorffii]|eukprot:XP_024520357.1 G-type lectin S-receptor-like serine/threonine-protein kinase SD2-5 [Selaginella moellendorffii]